MTLSIKTTRHAALGLCFWQNHMILDLLNAPPPVALDGACTTPQKMRRASKHAVVGIAVIAMLLPGTDPVTMLISMVPLVLLYELSIILAAVAGKPLSASNAAPAGQAGDHRLSSVLNRSFVRRAWGEHNREGRPRVSGASNLDLAAECLDDPLRKGKAEAGS